MINTDHNPNGNTDQGKITVLAQDLNDICNFKSHSKVTCLLMEMSMLMLVMKLQFLLQVPQRIMLMDVQNLFNFDRLIPIFATTLTIIILKLILFF